MGRHRQALGVAPFAPNDDLRGGAGKVVDAAEDEGFIQGAAATESPSVDDSPIHVHEAIFGWEGWSLSALRPGKRVRHENGKEIVEDVPTTPDPVHPILVTNRIRLGTLPRLRFGRSYAMRAWLVDLAGNSRPHKLNPPPLTPARVVDALGPLLGGAAAPSMRRLVSPQTCVQRRTRCSRHGA